jgi:predicted negative regulator of RcsB-dependent stress response
MSNNEIIENETEYVEQTSGDKSPSGLGLFVDKIKSWLNTQNKALVYGISAVILALVAYMAYQFLYQMPREKEGLSAIYKTQELFDVDSFSLVLKDAPKLADKFSGTKAGDLASYYAGASYLYTGDYKKAIEYLEQVGFNDQVMKYQAIGLLGDAQVENKDLDAGLKNYLKAAKGAENEFSKIWFYKKAARVYEKKNEWKEALDIYENLKKDYSENDGIQEIEKFIARAKAKIDQY